MEKVSIIVPVYNSALYLQECLKSISNQTYTDFKVLLIDDGSTDNSFEICMEWVNQDTRFEYHYKPNGGVSSARNYGMELMRGDYFTFIDSDDWIEPSYLQVLYDNIVAPEVDMSVVGYIQNGNHPASKDNKIISNTQALDCILDAAMPWVGYAWGKLLKNTPPYGGLMKQ